MGFFVRFGCGAALLVAFLVGAWAETPAPTRTYEQWVAMAEASDPAVDWTALRQAYVHSPSYDGYGGGWRAAGDDLVKALNGHDCAEAMRVSEAILKADFTYPLVHVALGNCHRKAGETAAAQREYTIFEGLTGSILASGDGTSVAKAYVVVTMAEERFVLMHFDVMEAGQALIIKDGHNYDRIDGVNPTTGEKKQVYFNVDAMFGSLTRKLGQDKQE